MNCETFEKKLSWPNQGAIRHLTKETEENHEKNQSV
jgi:hypothetical protein